MARRQKRQAPRRRPFNAEPPKKVSHPEPFYVDYKDLEMLKRYLNEQGKLLPRRVTGASARFQRKLTRAVKRARHMALIPFVADTIR